MREPTGLSEEPSRSCFFRVITQSSSQIDGAYPEGMASCVAPIAAAIRVPALARHAAKPRARAIVPLRAVNEAGEYISVRDTIEAKIAAEIDCEMLVVNDDSAKHSLHKGMHDGNAKTHGAESHFSVVVVSESFAGMNPVKRHRQINAILKEEFDAGLHALQLTTRTPAEHAKATGGK